MSISSKVKGVIKSSPTALKLARSVYAVPQNMKNMNMRSVFNEARGICGGKVMFPNLFLIGAGRCGTTSLHKLFSENEFIYAPELKEPTFLCDEQYRKIETIDEYIKLYKGVGKKSIYSADCSPVYLFSESSPTMINNLVGEKAKILVILRNPVHMAYSLFNHAGYTYKKAGLPVPDSLIDAINSEEDRFGDPEYIEKSGRFFMNTAYTHRGRYFEQLQKWVEIFGLENINVIFYEEIFEHGKIDTSSLGRILDLPDNSWRGSSDIRINASKSQPISSNEASKVAKYYIDDVKKLESLLGRSLIGSIWDL